MNVDERPATKVPLVLFGLLLAMSVVIGLVLLSEEVQPSHGFEHGTFADSMQQGGSGAQRHSTIRWHGLVFGLLQIAFFVGCLALGLRRRPRAFVTLVVCGILFASAFTMMVVFDHFYAQGSTRSIVLGFPVPTAWMIYGLGGVPLLFVLIYVWKFDDWVLSSDDLSRIEKIAAERRSREESID